MTKKELAEALGISGSMVSRLAKQGMPVSSVAAARAWRELHLETARMKGFRADTPYTPQPQRVAAAAKANSARLAALRSLVRASDTDLFLPLNDWLALVDYCISHRARQRLQALGTGAPMVTASGLERMIYGKETAGDGRMWFNLAGDAFEIADTPTPEVDE